MSNRVRYLEEKLAAIGEDETQLSEAEVLEAAKVVGQFYLSHKILHLHINARVPEDPEENVFVGIAFADPSIGVFLYLVNKLLERMIAGISSLAIPASKDAPIAQLLRHFTDLATELVCTIGDTYNVNPTEVFPEDKDKLEEILKGIDAEGSRPN